MPAGRPRGAVPKALLRAYLAQELKTKMDLVLFSEAEGRVPLGDVSRFVEARIKEYFDWSSLDLFPYGFPQGAFVRGPRSIILALEQKLQGKS